jgi:hypothetical protein
LGFRGGVADVPTPLTPFLEELAAAAAAAAAAASDVGLIRLKARAVWAAAAATF